MTTTPALIDVTTFTEAEMDFFLAATTNPSADFNPDEIRDHVFDTITTFLAATGRL